jgi:adenylate kinase family enzyme
MHPIPPLETLGRRIAIIGPSNAGKSTLTEALAKRLGLPAVHLDHLRFFPHSAWQLRPKEDFTRDHDVAVVGEDWIIEGNYFSGVPLRLQRATGIIQLSDNRFANYWRYLRRTYSSKRRAGGLEGARETFSREMTKWILFEEPAKHAARLEQLRASGLPFVETRSMAETQALYDAWSLERA